MAGYLKKYFVIYIFLLLLTLTVFGNGLFNELFFDDEELIYRNVYVQNIQYWPRLFVSNMIEGAGKVSNMYRPVLMLTFGIDYLIWKSNPLGFHLTNILIHSLNGFLIFILLERLFKKRLLAIFTAIFFIIHPIQTEAVTYASGRTDPLYSFFTLTGLLFFYLHRKEKNKIMFYACSILFFILALLTKENAIIFVPLLLLISFIEERKITRDILAKTILLILPFLLISLIYFLFRITIFNFSNTLNFYAVPDLYSTNIIYRIYSFSSAFWQYLVVLFWPTDLISAREVNLVMHWYDAKFLGLVAFVLFAIFFFIKKNFPRVLIFSFFWFFIILFPVSGVIPINNKAAEHYLYLPSVGFFLTFSYFFVILLAWVKNKQLKLLIYCLLFIMIVSLSTRTILRTFDWRDPETFYTKSLSQNFNNAPMHNNLAMFYAENGQLNLSEREYKIAISIEDRYPQTHHNLANLYMLQGKYDLAEEEYKKALSIDPNFRFSVIKLRELYLKQNLTEEEIKKKFQSIFSQNER